MAYDILSARYANADSTAAVINTSDHGDVAISERDRAELWAKLGEWAKGGGAVTQYIPREEGKRRDPLADLNKLTAALIAKSVISESDIANATVAKDLGDA